MIKKKADRAVDMEHGSKFSSCSEIELSTILNCRLYTAVSVPQKVDHVTSATEASK